MRLLQVSHLFKYNKEALVLNDIQFGYDSFFRLAIAGETGSGKTTLLKIIAGLIQPDEGEVLFEEERVLGPAERLLPGRPRIAYLSQHFELRNNYKVNDYLAMASKVGEKGSQRIYRLCRIDHLLHRKTDQLSGGERQRTALARLLIASPRLLLLDEPYSNLDGLHKQTLKAVINDVVAESGTACIIVSHDPADVLPWAEEVLVLKGGKLVQKGTPEQVYKQPMNEHTGGLFGNYNLLSAAQGKIIFGLNGAAEGKQLFIRPESIHLQKHAGPSIGIVSRVSFFGSHYEVEVVFPDGLRMTAKIAKAFFQVGETVSATVAPGEVWFL